MLIFSSIFVEMRKNVKQVAQNSEHLGDKVLPQPAMQNHTRGGHVVLKYLISLFIYKNVCIKKSLNKLKSIYIYSA